MELNGRIVKNSTEYELQYWSIKKRAKRAVWIYISLILIIGIAEIVYYEGLYSIAFGYFVVMLRTFFITNFFIKSWHDNLREGTKKKIPFWWGILTVILLSFDLLASLLLIIPCLFLYLSSGISLLIAYFDFCMLMLAVVPFLLYYWIMWLRIYRWTWDELQLPVQERKRIYREKKRIRREEKRAARHNYVQEKMKTAKEIFHRSNNGKPIKSQTDRRAELENLKKLYEDGLIDEEEYKKAREKALDIK